MSGWVEFTDGGISEWTCGGGGQVITTWSHGGPAESGTLQYNVHQALGVTTEKVFNFFIYTILNS